MALKDDWITGDVYTAGDQNDVADEVNAKVPGSRTITAGTGLTGGGDLSANRSLAVAYGTSAGTAAQGNDSRITGAAPSSRTITAGTGLTGGGDLTANRTLSADFGSGAGKVCEGNDTRLSDARTPTAHSATLVTSDTLDAARIPDLAASKITSGTLDAALVPNLAASKITSGTLDAARIPAITSSMITDGTIVNADVNASAGIVGSKLADASVMLVKLGSDVGPAMQSMIDASIATAQTVAIRTVSGTTDTLVLTDQSKAIECTSGSATTITIPPNSSVAFPVGSVIEVAQCGAGQVTLAPGGGVTLSNRNGLKTAGQWATLTLRKRATDGWIVGGDAAS